MCCLYGVCVFQVDSCLSCQVASCLSQVLRLSTWAQPCTGACSHVVMLSLPTLSLDVPFLVSSAAEGALDKDGALHSNCSYLSCPQLLPL